MPTEIVQAIDGQEIDYFVDWLKANGLTEIKIEGKMITFTFDTNPFDADPNQHWFQAYGPFSQLLLGKVISPSFYSWLRYHGADGSQREYAGPNAPSKFIIYFPLPRRS